MPSPRAESGGDEARRPEPSAGGERNRPSLVQPGADQLLYISDLVGELGLMAREMGCPTLAGILSLAREEAELERRRR